MSWGASRRTRLARIGWAAVRAAGWPVNSPAAGAPDEALAYVPVCPSGRASAPVMMTSAGARIRKSTATEVAVGPLGRAAGPVSSGTTDLTVPGAAAEAYERTWRPGWRMEP